VLPVAVRADVRAGGFLPEAFRAVLCAVFAIAWRVVFCAVFLVALSAVARLALPVVFLVAERGVFFAVFRVDFVAGLRAVLCAVFPIAERGVFFAALRVDFAAALVVVLRAVFLVARREATFAVFRVGFTAVLRGDFLAAFFGEVFLGVARLRVDLLWAGRLRVGVEAGRSGAVAAGACGCSVILQGNVVAVLIGCSSGGIIDSGLLKRAPRILTYIAVAHFHTTAVGPETDQNLP
jgi:hypothetical protein